MYAKHSSPKGPFYGNEFQEDPKPQIYLGHPGMELPTYINLVVRG